MNDIGTTDACTPVEQRILGIDKRADPDNPLSPGPLVELPNGRWLTMASKNCDPRSEVVIPFMCPAILICYNSRCAAANNAFAPALTFTRIRTFNATSPPFKCMGTATIAIVMGKCVSV